MSDTFTKHSRGHVTKLRETTSQCEQLLNGCTQRSEPDREPCNIMVVALQFPFVRTILSLVMQIVRAGEFYSAAPVMLAKLHPPWQLPALFLGLVFGLCL
jgi:hypothetical protein